MIFQDPAASFHPRRTIASSIGDAFWSLMGRGAALDLGVEVVAVLVFNLQKPAHVVDAGNELAAAFNLIFHAKGL